MSELSELAAHIRAKQGEVDELRARLKALMLDAVASGKLVRWIAGECGVSVQRVYAIMGRKKK